MSHVPAILFVPVQSLCDVINVPHDQMRLLLCLLSAIPLGFLQPNIPTATARHVYALLIGLFFAWFVCGNGVVHVFAASLIVWTCAMQIPPQVMTAILIAYITSVHLYRLYTDFLGWSMDVSLIMMIFVVKASTFSYNMHDGADPSTAVKEHVRRHRLVRALTVAPSLLEYLSYQWTYAGVLTGPCIECKEYLDVVNATTANTAPSNVAQTLRTAAVAALCYIPLHVHTLLPIVGYVDTKQFHAAPFLYRLLYSHVTVTCGRFKYYFAWYLSEAGCIATGLGYKGQTADGDADWSRCTNVRVSQVELGTSMPIITNNWNMGVNNWLKFYVYDRLVSVRYPKPLDAKTVANFLTKLTAACWHGVYPAYYFFFIGAFVVSAMEEAIRARIEPRISRDGVDRTIYSVVAWILIFGNMNPLGMVFMMLETTSSVQFWADLYYYNLWLPVIILGLIVTLVPLPKTTVAVEKNVTMSIDTATDKHDNKKDL